MSKITYVKEPVNFRSISDQLNQQVKQETAAVLWRGLLDDKEPATTG